MFFNSRYILVFPVRLIVIILVLCHRSLLTNAGPANDSIKAIQRITDAHFVSHVHIAITSWLYLKIQNPKTSSTTVNFATGTLNRSTWKKSVLRSFKTTCSSWLILDKLKIESTQLRLLSSNKATYRRS